MYNAASKNFSKWHKSLNQQRSFPISPFVAIHSHFNRSGFQDASCTTNTFARMLLCVCVHTIVCAERRRRRSCVCIRMCLSPAFACAQRISSRNSMDAMHFQLRCRRAKCVPARSAKIGDYKIRYALCVVRTLYMRAAVHARCRVPMQPTFSNGSRLISAIHSGCVLCKHTAQSMPLSNKTITTMIEGYTQTAHRICLGHARGFAVPGEARAMQLGAAILFDFFRCCFCFVFGRLFGLLVFRVFPLAVRGHT